MPNKIFQKLAKELRIVTKKGKNGTVEILPGEYDSKEGKVKPLSGFGSNRDKKDSDFYKMWKWWIDNNYDDPASFQNRLYRMNDLSHAYYNDSIFSTGIEILADETIQPDSRDENIQVFAKDKKKEKEITEFFQNIGIDAGKLRAIAFDLALYGDAFWTTSVSLKEGVKKITPVSPYSVTQRLEFSLAHVTEQYRQKYRSYASYFDKNDAISQLIDIYKQNGGEKNDDVSNLFETYLFGYQVNSDIVVPPWTILHFRRFSNESEFFPFGKPAFIHAIAPYRMLHSAMNLQALARVANFPLKVFKVKTDENMGPDEKWEAVSTMQQEYSNIGVTNTGKDEFSVNDEIWTIEDLLTVDIESPNISINDIADIEMLRDSLLTAMRIPKGYIPVANDNNWGDSGKSLTKQSKIFARMVYINQTALIQGLVDLVKLHYMLLGQEIPDFEISLPYPSIEEDSDRQRFQSDSIRLAKDIIDNLGGSLGLDRDEALPIEIVKDIFTNYSFLDSEEIDTWLKTYEKEKESEPEVEEEPSGGRYGGFRASTMDSEKKTRIMEAYSANKESLVRDAYFENCRKKTITEGINRSGYHYVTSFATSSSMDEWKHLFKGNKGRLQESELNKFTILDKKQDILHLSDDIEVDNTKLQRLKETIAKNEARFNIQHTKQMQESKKEDY